MIIFNGEKYSCVSCIRGHRSSSCKHSNRMLVKVRTRGRPSPLDIRKVILVDKDSRVEDTQRYGQHCGGGSKAKNGGGCCGMNEQPVLFLRAITTKKALLVNGDLKIMVTSEASTPDSEVAKEAEDSHKFVSEHEFMLNHVSPKHQEQSRCAKAAQNAVVEHSCCAKKKTMKRESKCCAMAAAAADAKRVKYEDQSQLPNISNESMLSSVSSANNHCPANLEFHDSVVELFTQKGAYLSTTCSCDDNCQCANCLIHREEAELEKYLNELNQPMVNLGSAHLITATSNNNTHNHENNNAIGHIQASADTSSEKTIVDSSNEFFNNMTDTHNIDPMCLCEPDFCMCFNCEEHPDEVITLSNIMLHGVLNYKWSRKMIIDYKEKAVHSKYWWKFLTEEVPAMDEKTLRSLDLFDWFDNLIRLYSSELFDISQVKHMHEDEKRLHQANDESKDNNNFVKKHTDVKISITEDNKNTIPTFGRSDSSPSHEMPMKRDISNSLRESGILMTGNSAADMPLAAHDHLKFNNLIL